MDLSKLYFYLEKSQSHGQNDNFLRVFLLKLNLCRPQEDLKNWSVNYSYQKSIVELFESSKNLRIIIFYKIVFNENQKQLIDAKIEEYRQSLKHRERLIFIELTQNVESELENYPDFILIENKNMIEFREWRKTFEIKEFFEVCLEILEDKNWFKREINCYLDGLKTL